MFNQNQYRHTLLKRFLLEVWSNGDLERCDAYVADAYKIHHDPGDLWEGLTLDLAQFKARVKNSRAPFSDQQFLILEMLSDEGKVMVTWDWRATHVGDLPNLPATGRSIYLSGATVYYFNFANKITGHWQTVNRPGVYQQLQRARRVGVQLG